MQLLVGCIELLFVRLDLLPEPVELRTQLYRLRDVDEVDGAADNRAVIVDQRRHVDVEHGRHAVRFTDLDAAHGGGPAFSIDQVDRGSQVDRPVGDVQVPQCAADVIRVDREKLAGHQVGADQDAKHVYDQLRVRRSLGGQLAHAKLPGHVVGGLGIARLSKHHEPLAKLQPGHLGEDVLLHVDRREQPGVAEDHLGPAQKQISVVVQRVVEPGQDPALRLRREIDECVPADEQVEAGDGRVLRDVVPAEDDRPAQRTAKHVAFALAFEILRPEVFGKRGQVLGAIPATPLAQRIFVDVRGIDLDPVDEACFPHRFAIQDRRRVGLLARG